MRPERHVSWAGQVDVLRGSGAEVSPSSLFFLSIMNQKDSEQITGMKSDTSHASQSRIA